jgi:DNA-binding beta-propeller fold protein YncE
VMQIGKIAPSKGSGDTTQLGKPAETAIDKEANEIYVADGYGNRRVIVFDATTGAYKRHWGAYGKPPSDDKQPPYDPKAPAAQQFANPVHCVKLTTDGMVYVCDRINNRIQVFKKDGTFMKEWFFEKNTLGNGAVWDIAVWPDPKQTWLLSADGENNEIRVLKRDDGTVVGSFGRSGRNAGQFHWIHAMAVEFQGQRLYRRSRHRKADPEIQADIGRATIGGLPRSSETTTTLRDMPGLDLPKKAARRP